MKILVNNKQFLFLFEQQIKELEGEEKEMMDLLLNGYLLGICVLMRVIPEKEIRNKFTSNFIIDSYKYIKYYISNCERHFLVVALIDEGPYKIGYDIAVNRLSKYIGFPEKIYDEKKRNALIKPTIPLDISKMSIDSDGLIDYEE
jgi:hypothetical protein